MANKLDLGTIVLYRTDGRNGLIYDLPAIITCTKDSHPGDYPAAWDVHREGWPDGCVPGTVPLGCNGVSIEVARGMGIVHKSHLEICSVHGPRKNPLPVPESDTHVHLTVFTPGGFGTQVKTIRAGTLGRPASEDFVDAVGMTPGSGTYVEWNVPFWNKEGTGSPDGNPDKQFDLRRAWRYRPIDQFDESDNDDGDGETIRAKCVMDEATTLSEAASQLVVFANHLLKLEQEGWRLRSPVKDDYGFIYQLHLPK